MLLTEHHLEFLSLKEGCTSSSESTHAKMPHCWKSHAMAQIKDRKHIEQNFHSVAKVMLPGGTAGCWGSQKL